MTNVRILALQVVVNVAAWSTVLLAWVRPRLASRDRRTALRAVIAPQMFRVIGMTMLAQGVASPELPRELAQWIGYGDLATSLLAIAAVAALGRDGWPGTALAALATAVGLADLLHNLALGAQLRAADSFGAAWFIPSTLVPPMLVFHVVALTVLFRKRAGHEQSRAEPRAPS